MYDDKFLYPLFNVVRKFVLSAGGDGGGYIISKDYIRISNMFHEYEKTIGKWFLEKYTSENGDGVVVFSNNQEAIIFCKEDSCCPSYAEEIVVKI